jgi:hypothetical protein
VAAAPYHGGEVNVHQEVNVSSGAYWGGYYRPAYGYGAAAAGLAVGTAVATLPAAATTVVVNSQTYYVVGGTYYRTCYQGADVSYCVVQAPSP